MPALARGQVGERLAPLVDVACTAFISCVTIPCRRCVDAARHPRHAAPSGPSHHLGASRRTRRRRRSRRSPPSQAMRNRLRSITRRTSLRISSVYVNPNARPSTCTRRDPVLLGRHPDLDPHPTSLAGSTSDASPEFGRPETLLRVEQRGDRPCRRPCPCSPSSPCRRARPSPCPHRRRTSPTRPGRRRSRRRRTSPARAVSIASKPFASAIAAASPPPAATISASTVFACVAVTRAARLQRRQRGEVGSRHRRRDALVGEAPPSRGPAHVPTSPPDSPTAST